jgi:predicted nucleotidyltransferase
MVRVLAHRDVGYLRRPLDLVFGAPSHIAILRALAQRAQGATGAEVARAAGTTNQAALDSLGRLEEVGVVSRLPMGRGYVFRLNRDHELVKRALLPLLREEAEFMANLRAALRNAFEREVLSGLIFGSMGRGEERPESDLDLCLVVKRKEDKERVLLRAATLSESLRSDFGVRVSPIALTAEEFSKGLRRGNELMRNIRADGDRFAGRPLEVILHG